MAVPISPRTTMKKLHFLQKQKHHHSVPLGTSKELKMELTVHLETLLLKIMLSSLFHENCFWNASLMFLALYSCFIPVWLRDRGQPSGRGINEVWRELVGKMKRVRAWPLPCYGPADCAKGVSVATSTRNGADRGGNGIGLGSWLRSRQREEHEQREAVSLGPWDLLLSMLLRIFPILFTIVRLFKMMEGDKCGKYQSFANTQIPDHSTASCRLCWIWHFPLMSMLKI